MTATFPVSGAPARILIVDDNPGNIQLLAEALRPDFEIYFATTPEKALELAEAKRVDLILLDVVMPDTDGYEVCARLKRHATLREVPVIFVTAKTEIEDEARGFAVGAVDYITKPISPPIVQARVRTHLELKAQRDYLQSLSNLDGLTGIPNRRHFDEMLQRELARALREAAPLSLYLADVDYFKQYNDHYGHLAGDEALIRIARRLQESLQRPGDFVARYGGEEFVVLCPGTPLEDACTLAQRLLDAVAALRIGHAQSAVASHVTVSIGGVTLLPSAPIRPGGRELSGTDLLWQADQRLYEAKRDGRGQLKVDAYRHAPDPV